jgi:hypothetical protein
MIKGTVEDWLKMTKKVLKGEKSIKDTCLICTYINSKNMDNGCEGCLLNEIDKSQSFNAVCMSPQNWYDKSVGHYEARLLLLNELKIALENVKR